MDPAKIDALLDLFSTHERRNALWYIDVFERWNMPAAEADEWRRRILARGRFVELDLDGQTEA